jgi:DNA-binding NarL/FixJ family response regulator
MVVDDSPGVLQSLILLLRYFEFETIGFLTSQPALAAMDDYKPDVLICDAHIEEMEDQDAPVPERIEGLRTASKVKRVRPACRVIVLSSNMRPNVLVEGAHRLGADVQVLAKPTNPPELISAVRCEAGHP